MVFLTPHIELSFRLILVDKNNYGDKTTTFRTVNKSMSSILKRTIILRLCSVGLRSLELLIDLCRPHCTKIKDIVQVYSVYLFGWIESRLYL